MIVPPALNRLMRPDPFRQTFGHTTIDPDAVRQYICADPGWLKNTMAANDDKAMHTMANHADYVEFHLRRYLMGDPKTLHRVFHEVRRFIAVNAPGARQATSSILKRTGEELLAREWYELMPRYQYARRRLKQVFGLYY